MAAGLLAALTGCEICESNSAAGIPRITCQPEDHSVTNGETKVQFHVEAKGENLEFQWFQLEPSATSTAEVLMDGQTNKTLVFDSLSSSNYGLYFCQVLNHPRREKPPFGLVRETRSRVVSLSGPMKLLKASVMPLPMGLQPPVEGNVRVGSAGKNDCVKTTCGYVIFPDSGTGYSPDPTGAMSCVVLLSNATRLIPPSDYQIAWNSAQPLNHEYGGCMTTNATNAYFFNIIPVLNNTFMFTVFFPTKSTMPPSGTQLFLTLNWE